MSKYESTKVYGDTEGPYGFPMLDAVAKDVDELVKDLPEECRELGYQRRTIVGPDVQLDKDERAEISVISSDAIDRDNEVMLPGGADWKQFKRNPVVTFAHEYRALPVGRSQWVKRQKGETQDQWLAKTEYTKRPEEWEGPWLPDAVWHMIKEGHLRGKSVGFIPMEARPPTEQEIKVRPALAGVSRIIAKWIVLEYAVAPVQSNPDALVAVVAKAKAAGIEIPSLIEDRLGIIIPDMPKIKTREELPEPAQKAPIESPKRVIRLTDVRKQIEESIGKELSAMRLNEIVQNDIDRLRGKV